MLSQTTLCPPGSPHCSSLQCRFAHQIIYLRRRSNVVGFALPQKQTSTTFFGKRSAPKKALGLFRISRSSRSKSFFLSNRCILVCSAVNAIFPCPENAKSPFSLLARIHLCNALLNIPKSRATPSTVALGCLVNPTASCLDSAVYTFRVFHIPASYSGGLSSTKQFRVKFALRARKTLVRGGILQHLTCLVIAKDWV